MISSRHTVQQYNQPLHKYNRLSNEKYQSVEYQIYTLAYIQLSDYSGGGGEAVPGTGITCFQASVYSTFSESCHLAVVEHVVCL